jgi:outer membrane protein TolC
MRSIKFFLIIKIILISSFNLSPQTGDLDLLVEEVIRVSPQIKMLEAKRNASYFRIDQNSNLPDPVLTLGLMNMPTNSFSFTQEPMTQKVIGLRQTIPFPGRLSAIEDAAAIDTLIIDQEIKDAENEIRKIVRQKYFELSYLRRSLLLAEESKRLLETISEVVNTNYIVSAASQQNVIKVQLEITNLLEKINKLKSMELSVLSELNSLLLRGTFLNIETEDFDNVRFVDVNVRELDSLAKQHRPFLKRIHFAEKKAELKQFAAEKEFHPNFTLGVQYAFRDNIAATGAVLNDLFSVVLGVSLPFNYGGKYSSKVEESISLQQLYSEQYSLALQNLQGNFGSILSQVTSLEERITLFEEGLLPQAHQNFESALASYQVNEIDFINVIDAQDQLFKIEMNLYQLKIDYLKQIAELEFLIGTSLK